MKRLHLALGVADVVASADDYLQRFGCQPDLFIPGTYGLWRTDAVNLLIEDVGHEEGGARRRHGA
ncbi:MAG TPA: hypothetical protein VK626_06960 [Nitrospiraceae bacterium]|nr:hypothetical protein [Nitrospiraceae bacterium]